MGKLGRAGWVFALVCCLLLPNLASAQEATVAVGKVFRDHLREDERPPLGISLADCIQEDALTVELSFGGGYPSYALEAWAGAGCESLTARLGPTAVCWKVFDSKPENPVESMKLPVRDLLRGRTGGQSDGSVPSECVPSSTSTLPQSVGVFFLLVDEQGFAAASASLDATYKLRRPPAPGYAFATPGDGQLLIDFGFDSPPPNSTIESFRFFCEPSSGCAASTLLVPGANVGPELEALSCGAVDRTAASGPAGPLDNGTAYHVAVASRDTYGNLSALSPIACASPVEAPAVIAPASSSSETSSACSFSPRPEPLPILGVGTLAGLGLVRRRKLAQARQNRLER